MSDPLSRLRGLASEINARDEELRAGFKELEARLKDASGDYSVRGPEPELHVGTLRR
jgi:hypothetical protein